MPIVNFAIPKAFEKQVQETIKKRGIVSRAEFFRMAAMYFMSMINRPDFKDESERFAYLTEEIGKEINRQYSGKKLPSDEEQLANI